MFKKQYPIISYVVVVIEKFIFIYYGISTILFCLYFDFHFKIESIRIILSQDRGFTKRCYSKILFADLLQNRFSKEFRKFHRKTPVLESLFTNVTGLQRCNFIKKRLQHRCFPVKFAKFLRTSFWQNASRCCLWTCKRPY